MLSCSKNAVLEITQVVYDNMQVWVKCPTLKNSSLRYHILNTQKNQVRKGSFVGEAIQLNLFHLPDGNYVFNLHDENGTEFSMPFVKNTKKF